MPTKFGMCSVPRHRDKRRLIAPAQRGPAAFSYANRSGVQVFGMAEMDGVTKRHGDRHRPAWDGYAPPPNNDAPGELRDIGNGVWWRRRHADLVDSVFLRQDLDSRRRDLFLPVVLLDLEGDGRVAVIQYHTIRAKLDRDDNREALAIVGGYAQRCLNAGLPTVVLADGNNPAAPQVLANRSPGGSVGAERDVMFVMGFGMEWLGRPGGKSRGELDWTDHGVPTRRGRPAIRGAHRILAAADRPRRLPNP